MHNVIIAGGRDFDDYDTVVEVMDELYANGPEVTIVHGVARGADALGARWGLLNGTAIIPFPADWDKHGKGAGYIRNAEMAHYADVLVAFWDGKSKGTKHMIDLALSHGLEVHVYMYGRAYD